MNIKDNITIHQKKNNFFVSASIREIELCSLLIVLQRESINSDY